MKNSKKSVVQLVKVFKLSNGELEKINNDLSVEIAVNYLLQVINLFLILINKFGLKIG